MEGGTTGDTNNKKGIQSKPNHNKRTCLVGVIDVYISNKIQKKIGSRIKFGPICIITVEINTTCNTH